MDVQLTEDEMADIKKEVLLNLRPYLVHKIRADRHMDYLRSRRIVTKDDEEEIRRKYATQREMAGHLLDLLAENPRGLDTLVESIQLSRTQNFIIAKITDEVQKVKNKKMDSLRAEASSSSADQIHISTSGPMTTSDYSRTFSNESTMLYHPDGEASPSTSDIGSLSLPMSSLALKGEAGGEVSSSDMGRGSMVAGAPSSGMLSSILPRPGDPGAPPLPEEQQQLLEVPSGGSPTSADAGGGVQGRTNSPGGGGGPDSNFQPLRSRSLTPTSNRDIYSSPGPPKSH